MTTKQDHIVQSILLDIDKGRLRQGQKLPSFAEMQEQYGCSYGVCRSAILTLKALKWVRGEPGVGMFIQEQDQL